MFVPIKRLANSSEQHNPHTQTETHTHASTQLVALHSSCIRFNSISDLMIRYFIGYLWYLMISVCVCVWLRLCRCAVLEIVVER